MLYRYYKSADPVLAPFVPWAVVRYEAQTTTEYTAELWEDDWAFLEAHETQRKFGKKYSRPLSFHPCFQFD